MRRTTLRALPALLLLVPLTACGEDDPAAATAEPLDAGIIWQDGSEIHFPDGAVVDTGLEAARSTRTSHGVVASSWDEGTVYVTPDGTVTTLDVPDNAQISTDREQSVIAWTTIQQGDGVVHVLDPATGKERAAVTTEYDEAMDLALEGDSVWLYSNELATTLEIDWPSGKVTRSPLKYVRGIDRHYAVVEGGNENFVEAGAAKPGIIDIETRKLVRRGWDWGFSPRTIYAVTESSDGDRSTQDTMIVVVELATGKTVARFPARPDESGLISWTWTTDEKTIYWFEGSELVQCAIATSTCAREKVDAKSPQVV